jgi:beta-galactosidase GanA
LLSRLTASILQQSGVEPILPGVPEGVEVCQRSSEPGAAPEKSVLILINHTTISQHVPLPRAMADLLSESHNRVDSVDLPKYGVAVLER